MARIVAVTLAGSVASATALGALRSHSFMDAEMQPDVVAITMSHVEGEWKAQAHVAAQCKSQDNSGLPICQQAPKAFYSSCTKVVSAIMLSSQGNSIDAKEYMTSVCSQKTISGWQKSTCGYVGKSIVAHMSDDANENRVGHAQKADKTCDGLWEHFVQEQMSEEQTKEAKDKIDVARKEAQAKKTTQPANHVDSSIERVFKAIGKAKTHKVRESKKLPQPHAGESVGLAKKSTKQEEQTNEAKDKIDVARKEAQAKKTTKPADQVESSIERAFKTIGKAKTHKVRESKKLPQPHAGESVGLAKKSTKPVDHVPVNHVEGSIERAFKIIGWARSRKVKASKKIPLLEGLGESRYSTPSHNNVMPR